MVIYLNNLASSQQWHTRQLSVLFATLNHQTQAQSKPFSTLLQNAPLRKNPLYQCQCLRYLTIIQTWKKCACAAGCLRFTYIRYWLRPDPFVSPTTWPKETEASGSKNGYPPDRPLPDICAHREQLRIWQFNFFFPVSCLHKFRPTTRRVGTKCQVTLYKVPGALAQCHGSLCLYNQPLRQVYFHGGTHFDVLIYRFR